MGEELADRETRRLVFEPRDCKEEGPKVELGNPMRRTSCRNLRETERSAGRHLGSTPYLEMRRIRASLMEIVIIPYAFKTPSSNLIKLLPVMSEFSMNFVISSIGRLESRSSTDDRCCASSEEFQCFGLVDSSGRGREGSVSDLRGLVPDIVAADD